MYTIIDLIEGDMLNERWYTYEEALSSIADISYEHDIDESELAVIKLKD